jgi:hypothetical protein
VEYPVIRTKTHPNLPKYKNRPQVHARTTIIAVNTMQIFLDDVEYLFIIFAVAVYFFQCSEQVIQRAPVLGIDVNLADWGLTQLHLKVESFSHIAIVLVVRVFLSMRNTHFHANIQHF